MNITARQAESSYTPFAEFQTWPVDSTDDLPSIPVLPETLLLLDLQVQERSIDLREVSELILSDLGATLQVMRLAGREHACTEFRPTRIEDCIADLGIDACLEAISAQSVTRNSGQSAIIETWSHSREIADHSKQIAEDSQEVDPREAYLVGLLHAIGLLPAVLGWAASKRGVSDFALAGFKLAKKWSLAPFIVKFLGEMNEDHYVTALPAIVREAHQRAVRSKIHCPLEQSMGPRLYKTF
ncbi:MAG: HDOD domain-containing protein [Terracidiphilus sp.]